MLVAGYPRHLDLHRLAQYEFLLVHSGDVANGPPSLHPSTPNRAGELLVRRGLIERGVLLMISRSVICRALDATGVRYFAGELAVPFLDNLRTPYTLAMRDRASWVERQFTQLDDEQLSIFMRTRWNNWGSEFERPRAQQGGDIS